MQQTPPLVAVHPTDTTMKKISIVASALVLLFATRLSAQNESSGAAYFALISTPLGELPTTLTSAMYGPEQRGVGFFGRYGQIGRYDKLRNVGAGADFDAGPGRFTATFGARVCDGCSGFVMVGAGWQGRIYSSAVSSAAAAPAAAPALTVGVNLDAGGGFPTSGSGSALSAGIGLPVALVIPAGTSAHVAPFLTPGLGIGRVSGGGDSRTGTRPMLGGGLGVLTDGGFGVTAGFNKIFIDNGETALTLAVSFTPKR